jgi:anti-sigma factor ChrR (cupin superfamily)
VTAIPDNVCPMRARSRFGENGAWLFDRLAAAIAPASLAGERHWALRERIAAKAAGCRSIITVRAGDGEWRALAPGVTIKLLRSDPAAGNMTAFIRMQPGASLQAHAHDQSEECLLLEGEIYIGRHRLAAGDMHVAAAGTLHDAISSPRGALLLVRAQNIFQS